MGRKAKAKEKERARIEHALRAQRTEFVERLEKRHYPEILMQFLSSDQINDLLSHKILWDSLRKEIAKLIIRDYAGTTDKEAADYAETPAALATLARREPSKKQLKVPARFVSGGAPGSGR